MNIAQRVNLKMLRLRLVSTTKKIDDIVAACRHSIVNEDSIAYCEDCETDFGWWCYHSPDHFCSYGTPPKKNCQYCGEHSERK